MLFGNKFGNIYCDCLYFIKLLFGNNLINCIFGQYLFAIYLVIIIVNNHVWHCLAIYLVIINMINYRFGNIFGNGYCDYIFGR